MARWRRLSNKAGRPIYVNIEIAMSVQREESTDITIIAFAGGPEDVVNVKEMPEEVLEGQPVN